MSVREKTRFYRQCSRSRSGELYINWNDDLAAILEAKLKAAMKAKSLKYDS